LCEENYAYHNIKSPGEGYDCVCGLHRNWKAKWECSQKRLSDALPYFHIEKKINVVKGGK